MTSGCTDGKRPDGWAAGSRHALGALPLLRVALAIALAAALLPAGGCLDWCGADAPAEVRPLAGVLAAGDGHSLALRDDGTVWAWGSNSHGQLGDGTLSWRPSPVRVAGLSGVTAVAAGEDYSLALTADGAAWAWGGNLHGQLGSDPGVDSPVPVLVGGIGSAVAIAAAGGRSAAVLRDGTVWVWGGHRDAPGRVEGLEGVVEAALCERSVVALRTDGTVWIRALEGGGAAADAALQVVGLEGIEAIGAGVSYFVALDRDGAVWFYGEDGRAGRGVGVNDSLATPRPVGGLDGACAIAAGDSSTLALRRDGSVWGWGYRSYGALGAWGSIESDPPRPVGGLEGVRAIASGQLHSLALRTDGTVWSWGSDYDGELGDGPGEGDGLRPAQVAGGGGEGCLLLLGHVPDPGPARDKVRRWMEGRGWSQALLGTSLPLCLPSRHLAVDMATGERIWCAIGKSGYIANR